jgi:phage nucleotide-binding protein
MSILGGAPRPEVQAPVRLWLYGAPNVGKTHFAKQFPKPLLLSTDGNYIYESIPANSLSNWEVGKLAKPNEKAHSFINILDLLKTSSVYQTVILDLIEGTHRLARDHFLGVLKITHEADLNYGKGYTIIKENFISAIEQLFKLPINVIIISHEVDEKIEPKNSAQYTVFKPALNNKLHSTVEGYCNLVARVSIDQDADGNRVRMLSMSPKEHEYGINRLGDSEDVVLVHNGDNYGDFYKVWEVLYNNRGLTETVNTTRVTAEEDKKAGTKDKKNKEIKRAGELAKEKAAAKKEKKPTAKEIKQMELENKEMEEAEGGPAEEAIAETKIETAAEKIARMKAKAKKNRPATEKEVVTETATPVKSLETAAEPIEDTQDEEPEMVRTPAINEKLARITELKRLKKARDKK